jgi:fused signal recognition particle receptor
VDDEVLDNLEEVLITSDVGVETTLSIIKRIEERVAKDKYVNTQELNRILREEIAALLTENNTLDSEEFTVPEGKTFLGWFIQTVSETGSTTMELAFEPNESNTVALPAQTVLEPMTLYALFQ